MLAEKQKGIIQRNKLKPEIIRNSTSYKQIKSHYEKTFRTVVNQIIYKKYAHSITDKQIKNEISYRKKKNIQIDLEYMHSMIYFIINDLMIQQKIRDKEFIDLLIKDSNKQYTIYDIKKDFETLNKFFQRYTTNIIDDYAKQNIEELQQIAFKFFKIKKRPQILCKLIGHKFIKSKYSIYNLNKCRCILCGRWKE